MNKLLLFLFSASLLWGQTIHFNEEKYIHALNNTLSKKGTLSFINESVILQYAHSNKKLIYNKDTLSIQLNGKTQTLDLNNQMALKMVFLLIQSIHTNNTHLLHEYFTVEQKKGITSLFPKASISSYIEFVQFKKDSKLHFMTIEMSNKNKTTIREIND